jgi:hypothetical protein
MEIAGNFSAHMVPPRHHTSYLCNNLYIQQVPWAVWHLSFNSDDGSYCILSFLNSLVSSSTFLVYETGWKRPLLTSQFSHAVSDEIPERCRNPQVTPSFTSGMGNVRGINIWLLINPHIQQGSKSYNHINTQEPRIFTKIWTLGSVVSLHTCSIFS